MIQALRHHSEANKAIDLGIALEVMLLHELDSDRGELKYRTSVRGAAFLGGEKEQRIKTFKLLKDAYDLRSGAVHSGKLKSTGTKIPSEVLNQTVELCAAIARKLIEEGSFPSWERDYVIGENR